MWKSQELSTSGSNKSDCLLIYLAVGVERIELIHEVELKSLAVANFTQGTSQSILWGLRRVTWVKSPKKRKSGTTSKLHATNPFVHKNINKYQKSIIMNNKKWMRSFLLHLEEAQKPVSRISPWSFNKLWSQDSWPLYLEFFTSTQNSPHMNPFWGHVLTSNHLTTFIWHTVVIKGSYAGK